MPTSSDAKFRKSFLQLQPNLNDGDIGATLTKLNSTIMSYPRQKTVSLLPPGAVKNQRARGIYILPSFISRCGLTSISQQRVL